MASSHVREDASARTCSRPIYVGEPTLAQVMRKPRWIAALVLAMIFAGFFAWLGQWQLSHAISTEEDTSGISETARPLSELTETGFAVNDAAAGMVVEVHGRFVPGDFVIVENRVHAPAGAEGGTSANGDADANARNDSTDNELGVWLTGHLETADDGALAVAIGWAATAEEAERARHEAETFAVAAEEQHLVTGRYMPADAALLPTQGGPRFVAQSMAPAQLVNLWQPFTAQPYTGYLVLHPAEAGAPAGAQAMSPEALGLEVIASVPPLPVETINWLNLFYAVEWVVFAGFAAYLWYRLARDDWEKIHELKLLAAAEAATGAQGEPATVPDARTTSPSPGIG